MTWTTDDYLYLIQAGKVGKFDPKDWLAFANSESGLNPKAVNTHGGAAGLWQAMPATLKGLGWHTGDPDFEACSGSFKDASIKTQIQWSLKYLTYWRKHFVFPTWNSARDMYLANFMPAYLPHKDEPDHVIIDSLKWPLGYKVNAGFDRDLKGYITVGDLGVAIDRSIKTLTYAHATTALKACYL